MDDLYAINRSWDDLSVKEAEEILTVVKNDHSGLVEKFRQDRSAKRRRSIETLDYTRDSLIPAWRWFLIFHNSPGSSWAIGKGKNMDGYNEPLIDIKGGPLFSPIRTFTLTRSFFFDKDIRRPDKKTGLVDHYDKIPTAEGPSQEEPDFEILRTSDSELTLSFSDEIAYDKSDQIDPLADHLCSQAKIKQAERTDRELICVSSSISRDVLKHIVAQFLEEQDIGL